MRSGAEVAEVLELAEGGNGASAIARRTGIPRATVRGWIAGRVPVRRIGDAGCPVCTGAAHRFAELPDSYVYLLGLYLGDGCISLHRQGVGRIRIHLDLKYPAIISECESAIRELLPNNRVHRELRSSNYTQVGVPTSVVVSAYSKVMDVPDPSAWTGKEARSPDRARALAGRVGPQQPWALPARTDPFRWLPLHQHGNQLASSQILLQ